MCGFGIFRKKKFGDELFKTICSFFTKLKYFLISSKSYSIKKPDEKLTGLKTNS